MRGCVTELKSAILALKQLPLKFLITLPSGTLKLKVGYDIIDYAFSYYRDGNFVLKTIDVKVKLNVFVGHKAYMFTEYLFSAVFVSCMTLLQLKAYRRVIFVITRYHSLRRVVFAQGVYNTNIVRLRLSLRSSDLLLIFKFVVIPSDSIIASVDRVCVALTLLRSALSAL